jgi:hypothetical protein
LQFQPKQCRGQEVAIMKDPDRERGRTYAEWYVVLGMIALVCVVVVGWKAAKVINPPSTEEAMRLSLAELRVPELTTAYALHPDTCVIAKTFWNWSVACEGVPIYFYQDFRRCDPGPPRTCRTVPFDYKNCRSFYWEIDLDGKPSNPIGDRGRYASIEEDCRPKGTLASEREAMARRGIAPDLVEIQ